MLTRAAQVELVSCFTASMGVLYVVERICKRFRLHERINPTDIFGNNQRMSYFCVIIKNNAL
jgi:hypothetical protein